jgi:hypothetical protein
MGYRFVDYAFKVSNWFDASEFYVRLTLKGQPWVPTFPRRGKNIMRIPPRHWLDYDSVALAVLMIAISVLELLVLGIWKQPVAASDWLPSRDDSFDLQKQ